MKSIRVTGIIFCIIFAGGVLQAEAQQTTSESLFKKYINHVVQKVKETNEPAQKRKLLNENFDKLISATEKAQRLNLGNDHKSALLQHFKQDLANKKNNLNGTNGFERVSANQLDLFADYVQQDFEQADEGPILWVVILGLLLLIGPALLFT
ncbi:MAG: hypothetical protein JXR26_03645 [Balneolaceae bacterium]|nr:hypothetical protein [Balneolaceae bacterium]